MHATSCTLALHRHAVGRAFGGIAWHRRFSEAWDLISFWCHVRICRHVVSRFARLTGRMALGPRWSLGFALTAMPLADAPDAQARLPTDTASPVACVCLICFDWAGVRRGPYHFKREAGQGVRLGAMQGTEWISGLCNEQRGKWGVMWWAARASGRLECQECLRSVCGRSVMSTAMRAQDAGITAKCATSLVERDLSL